MSKELKPGAREAAARSLLRIEKESRYSNLEADATLSQKKLSEADARLYTRLLYGTIEKRITLDYILSSRVSQSLETLDKEVLTVLRLGAYQILYSDRIPDSAAVNESVELCRRYKKSAAPLVNAVLRRLAREKNAIEYPSEKDDPVAFLSVYYGVSPGLCKLLLDEFGAPECKRFLAAAGEPPPTTLRVNTLKITREALEKELSEAGVAVKKTDLSPDGLKIPGGVKALAAPEEGRCFVQDEASQLCVRALDLRPGMTLLDLCAAPGGKSFGAAIEMENIGEVFSFDLHESKLSLIEKGAERLGISILRCAAGDARVFLPEFEERADRVLVDAPCSGLGVIAKKPDLRFKKPEDIARLPEIQAAILNNAARYVRPGGRLVYSTCTVLRRENEDVVDGFLAAHPEFEEAALCLPALPPDRTRVTLLPQNFRTDGFFIAALKRKDKK